MPLSAGMRLGSYEVLTPLGTGGMGEVYRARHRKLGRDVAIKVLRGEVASDPERRRRFEREARSASALNHPSIVTIHDIDEQDGTLYIAMELVEGKTLREHLQAGPLPLGGLLAWARQAAEGLARAHAAGIVHRDLKPENLMVTGDGLVKILDFGLAKVASSTPGTDTATTADQMTKEGVVLGTVPYMSPEQAAGRPLDFRSDQFSFGAILYEMATGRRAFRKGSTPQTLAAIIAEEPEPAGRLNPKLPPALVSIITRCLAKSPEGRFADTRDLAAALRAVPEADAGRRMSSGAWWAAMGLAAVVLAWAALPYAREGWRSVRPGITKPAIQAIAVLPLRNLSGDPEQEYFADGMTEALITDLSKIGALKVISRASAMRYKGTSKPLSEIARELHVDALLDGSVVREAGRIGITAQLIEASTDRTLWAERFDREVRSVLALQGEVARSVARQVAVTVTPEEQSRLAGSREVDPVAYEAYLKGTFHVGKLTPEGIEKGLAYLHEAVERDPSSALAQAGLALGYSLAASHSPQPPKDAFEKAQAAYRKALELDDTLAEGHAALAEAKLYRDWDWEAASSAFRRALQLNPSLARAHSHYGWYLNLVGRQAEAVEELQRARQLDPLDPTWAAWHADVNSYAGRYDDALVAAREAVELGPTHHWSYEALALAESGRGRHADAIAAGRKAAELNPGWRGALALAYAKAGMKDKALELIPELEKTKYRLDIYLLPAVAAAMGDRDRAVRWTQAAIDARNPFAPWLFTWNDVVGPLHDDPRYQALRARMRL